MEQVLFLTTGECSNWLLKNDKGDYAILIDSKISGIQDFLSRNLQKDINIMHRTSLNEGYAYYGVLNTNNRMVKLGKHPRWWLFPLKNDNQRLPNGHVCEHSFEDIAFEALGLTDVENIDALIATTM